jgi:hypothetical protein
MSANPRRTQKAPAAKRSTEDLSVVEYSDQLKKERESEPEESQLPTQTEPQTKENSEKIKAPIDATGVPNKTQITSDSAAIMDAPITDERSDASRSNELADILDNSGERADKDDHEPDASRFGFRDPSQVIPETALGDQRFGLLQVEAENYALMLENSGLVFVSCAHKRIVETAALFVAKADRFAGRNFGFRQLQLDYDKEDPRLRYLLHEEEIVRLGRQYPDGKTRQGHNIVIHVRHPSELAHVRNCCDCLGDRGWMGRGRFLIFEVSGSAGAASGLDWLPDEFPHWKIPALRWLLSPDSPPSPEAGAMEAELESARARGDWDKNEAKFLTDIEKILRKGGLKALKEEMANRTPNASLVEVGSSDPQIEPPTSRAVQQSTSSQDAMALWGKGDILVRSALFTAAYFEDLGVDDFHTVMEPLIEDEEVSIAEEEETFVPEQGKTIRYSKQTPRSAPKQWERHLDETLERAGLSYGDNLLEGKIIEFRDPAMRWPVKMAIGPGEARRMFERLHRSALLFHPKIEKSPRIIQGLIDLTVSMIRDYRTYDERWLLGCVGWIGSIWEVANQAEADVAESGREIRTDEDFLRLLDEARNIRVANRFVTDVFYKRLAKLGQELLADSIGAVRFEAFLAACLALGKGNHFHLIEVIRRIPEMPNFDRFEYFARILDSGAPLTRGRVTQLLLQEMRRSPEAYRTVLCRVAAWLPKISAAPETKPAARPMWALAFLYHLALQFRDSVRDDSADQSGFLPFNCGPGLGPENDRIQYLVNWLSNPWFPAAAADTVVHEKLEPEWLFTDVPAPDDLTLGEACRGEMIEAWYVAVADPHMDSFCSRLAAELKGKPALRLRHFLRWRVQCIFTARENEMDKARREELSQHRTKLFKLIARLDEAR